MTIGRTLKIPIDAIGAGGLDRETEIDASSLPLLDALIRRDEIHFTKPVYAHIHAKPAGDQMVVTGNVKTAVKQLCNRCLDPFETVIKTEFSAIARSEALEEDGGDSEMELMTEDMDIIHYHGNTLDLRDEIAQQIIMALPFSPLCDSGCKGLCIHCGANLNQASCDCRTSSGDTPFSILKTLHLPERGR